MAALCARHAFLALALPCGLSCTEAGSENKSPRATPTPQSTDDSGNNNPNPSSNPTAEAKEYDYAVCSRVSASDLGDEGFKFLSKTLCHDKEKILAGLRTSKYAFESADDSFLMYSSSEKLPDNKSKITLATLLRTATSANKYFDLVRMQVLRPCQDANRISDRVYEVV